MKQTEMPTSPQTDCRQCGKCCVDGGPALHLEDLPTVLSGRIVIDQLVTIRKGELVRVPFEDQLKPATTELIKLRGREKTWSCIFYDTDKGCTIYAFRPTACRLLKCWDMEDLMAVVERDTLSRFDIITEDDPLLPWMREHELACSCTEMEQLFHDGCLPESLRKELEQKVTDDLRIREHLVPRYQLSLEEELFRFGRPLFQQLASLGITMRRSADGVQLNWAVTEKKRATP